MKIKFKNIILLRSLFSKLIFSFLAIIMLVSGANYISYNMYRDNIAKEIEKTTHERLINVAGQYDFHLKEVKDNLLTVFRENFDSADSGVSELSDYEQKEVTDRLREMAEYDYLFETAILLKATDHVLTQNGVYNKERFFNRYYASEVYSEAFWLGEMEERFVYKVYPASDYVEKTPLSDGEIRVMTPIVYKAVGNRNLMVISFIDIETLSRTIAPNFIDNLYILNDSNELVYPSHWNEEIDFEAAVMGSEEEITKDYTVFRHRSDDSQLTYMKIYDKNFLKSQSRASEMTLLVMILATTVISVFIAFAIVNSVNRRAKKIYDIIKTAEKNYNDYDVIDLKSIEQNVGKLISENLDYMQDIDQKASLLKPYIYQSAIKNIYTDFDDIKEQIDLSGNYAIAYFKMHFKPEFYMDSEYSAGKVCFLLNELIGLYLREHFSNCITFQVDNECIVAAVEVENHESHYFSSFERVLKKLETEEAYILFTIGVSAIRDNIQDMNKAYLQARDLIVHRQLAEYSQLLLEKSTNEVPRKFRFSVEQSEQFIQSIRNMNEQECIRQIETLIDYNVRLKVNEFHIRMLCNELMNCFVKVITGLYYDIPDELKSVVAYNKLRNLYCSKQFKTVLQESARYVIRYISANREEEDHIVDFVKAYVEEHYSDEIYVEMLAEKLKITKTYLSTYFKSKTGTNLSEYITSVRIGKAIHLLETTDLKIKDVGVQVGIGNTNTFIRNFKKHIGQSPGEYRKANEF